MDLLPVESLQSSIDRRRKSKWKKSLPIEAVSESFAELLERAIKEQAHDGPKEKVHDFINRHRDPRNMMRGE